MMNKMRAVRGEVAMAALLVLRSAAKVARLMPAYRRFVARKIRRYGLFDATYYLEINADVASDKTAPEYHYVAYGDRENRQPMPLFDPAYYRAQSPGRLVRVNALMHYALVGRYRGISPSPWFDVPYYLSRNKDVARSGMDPLRHYLRFGGLEGRSPSHQFDGAYYLSANLDVALSGMHPLLHYLQVGRLQNRPSRAVDKRLAAANEGNISPLLPLEEDWGACRNRAEDSPPRVDVIVPVYKGRVETLRCLLSVLKAGVKTPFELIVINDASPDVELTADLERLAGRGLFTLLRNKRNMGFVATVNRGMALHAERDKLLLNADTETYNDWLDRLVTAAYRYPRTGTVTPLSNNATICSYPQFLHDNPYPLEIPYAELDRLAAGVNAGIEVETPTGVGFCMYIRRECLNEAGYFDEKSFQHGYGEENDFCQRAIQKGWRNVIAADVFVRHLGAVSFQGQKGKRLSQAMSIITGLHPGYHADVRRFIATDALAQARGRLDWERLKTAARDRNTLMVCHHRGGGAERHLQEDSQTLINRGIGVFYLRPHRGDPSMARIESPQVLHVPNLPSFRLRDIAELAGWLKHLRITRIQNYGMVDFEANAPAQLLELAKTMGIPLWFDIHDYEVICPRVNLASRDGRYCGEPDEQGCNKCLHIEGSDFKVEDIHYWRELHHQALRGADKILVPDADVAERLLRYYPDIVVTVSPHEELNIGGIRMRQPELPRDKPLRIVVIGAIGKIKGYGVLQACAQDARNRQLPLEFSLMGYSLNDRALERAGVTVTGRYLEHEAEGKLHALDPHMVWLPSLWPETYSYTLSLAIKGGYPVFAFDIGAIAGRLRRFGLDQHLMPLAMMNDSHAINEYFNAFRAACIAAEVKTA